MLRMVILFGIVMRGAGSARVVVEIAPNRLWRGLVCRAVLLPSPRRPSRRYRKLKSYLLFLYKVYVCDILL